MARYNTVTPVASTTTSATLSSTAQGMLTTFTGTGPYTVTLASPVLYSGSSQTYWNNTGSSVTLSSPSGNIKGPGFTAATSQTIPNQAAFTLTSDGTDYVVTNNEGGPQVGSTLVLTSSITCVGIANSGALTVNPSNQNVSITPTGTGTITLTSGTAGTINNMSIGASTRAAGYFTSLTANSDTTITSSSSSSGTTSGALVVSGGVGIAGNIYNGGNIVSSGNGTFTGTMAINSSTGSSSYSSGALVVSGGVGVGGALYVSSVINCGNDITAWYSSDENLKTNITAIENALDKIDAIGGDMFDWNETALAMYPDRTQRDIGLIAQKVLAQQPELVTKRENGYLAVNYEKTVALLMQGVKELRAEVKALKAKIGE